MARFKYTARDATGGKYQGELEAPNPAAVFNLLAKSNQWPISITPLSEKKAAYDLFNRRAKVRLEDLIFFIRQLGVLFASGIPLNVSLLILSENTENPTLAQAASQMHHDLEGGSTLYEALKRPTGLFPEVYVALIEAGEISGSLDISLDRVANLAERKAENRQRMMSLFTYPILVVSAIALVLFFLVLFVFPMFAKLFSQANVSLPLPTVIIIAFSQALRTYWYIGIAALVAGYFGIKWYLKTDAGRMKFDRMKLKLPLFGKLLLKIEVSSFAQTLHTLNSTGIPIISSLDIIIRTTGNHVIKKALQMARSSVESGATISQSLTATGIFPVMVMEMISTGEESGKMDLILEKISSFYDRDVDYTLKKIPVILEPFMLVVLGSIVALIYLSLILPMVDMIKVIRH